MTYQVLARKWRPQEFDTVVGQEPVTRTLRNALVSGRVAHAYLFTGPRGVGKTTTARLLAKALCCGARSDAAEACGQCPSCRDFVAGAPVDVMEIDAASNTSVDDIRTLRENVKYAPARGRFKVYIVDEVHMLSGAAFNAFLKTLEEPPDHVVFILATTDPKKIPATVLSRCQRFDFKPIAPDALTASLTAILDRENVPFEPAALPMLVRASEGSLRDALSLLDTAIAYGQGKLDEGGVAQLLGASSPVHVRAFVDALLARDGAAAVEAIDRAAASGEDLNGLCREVVETGRRLLVLKAAPSTTLAELTPAETEALRTAAAAVSVDELVYLLRAFLDADTEMRRSPYPRVELEIAAVRATRRPEPQALDALLGKVEDALAKFRAGGAMATPGAAPRSTSVQESLLTPPPTSATSAPSPPNVSVAGPRPPAPAPASERAGVRPGRGASASPGGRGETQAGTQAGPEPQALATEPSEARPAREASMATADAGLTSEEDAAPAGELDAAWQRVIEEIRRKKAMLASVLQGAAPVSLEAGVLTLDLAGNHFHREMLAVPANRDIINQAVQQLIPGARRIEVGGNGAAGGVSGPRHHPAVQAALNVFQGEVVAVRPRAPEEGEPS